MLDIRPPLLTEPFDRPFEPGAVFVPSEIQVEGDNLVWTMRDPKWLLPRGSVLDKFRRLHRSNLKEHVLEFAATFGVAFFCQHHRPFAHAAKTAGRSEDCWPRRHAQGWYEEDIADYRRFSQAADAIVSAARMVNAGRDVGEAVDDFFYVRRKLPGTTRKISAARQLAARQSICDEINQWVDVAETVPALEWIQPKRSWVRTIRHSPWGVLGAIAMALLTSVPEQSGWLICDACGETFESNRRASPNRNHFCRKCRGSSTMWALLKQQQRARRRK